MCVSTALTVVTVETIFGQNSVGVAGAVVSGAVLIVTHSLTSSIVVCTLIEI